MREGRVFRRCTKCGKKVDEKSCVCGNRNTSWAFVVDVAPEGASRKQKRGGGFATKADALKKMHDLQREHEDGTAVPKSKLSVGAWLDRWIKGRKGEMASGWKTADEHVRLYLKPRIGDVRLQGLDRATVKGLYADLEESGGRKGRPLARTTVDRVHVTLRKALNDAVADKMIRENPAHGARTAMDPTKADTPDPWAADELDAFLDWTHERERQWWPMWWLIAHTALRRGEAVRLRWRDLDLDAGKLTVRAGKSARAKRTIDLDTETIEVLRHLRSNRQVVSLHEFRDEGVFDCYPTAPTRAWERAMQRWPGRRIRLHDLRHTHATLLLLAGVPLHVVSERLGHASPAFTARIYAHVLPKQDRAAAEAFAALRRGSRGQAEAAAGSAATVDGA